ncbi:MAG: hypothetical protein M3Y72_12875 [Acidobacteriota bacterium]|nr:hypothetical protein [Acidobacteriota bacterium]
MLFPPQPEEEVAVHARQLPTAMEADMAADAQGNVSGGSVRSRTPVMHHEQTLGQADLATPVPGQHLLAVVTGAAQSLGDERRIPAGPAPPGRLFHLLFPPTPLPCPVPSSTRIEAKDNPLSSAAPTSCPSSHSALTVTSSGRSQTPVQSNARSAEATTSASSGR